MSTRNVDDKELPFISCKTITYGRADLLEEAIHSFLIQDYPEDKCELIIVNDYPEQKLIYDHPRIKIYNLDETFSLIGEKENYAIERCKGELIAVWDDDDIALKCHLRNIAENWDANTNIIHWNTGVHFDTPNIAAAPTPIGNAGIAYSKDAWERIGKSPLENAGGDMTLILAIRDLDRNGRKDVKLPDEKLAFFYMWGDRSYHQSGQGKDDDTRPNIVIRNANHIEKEKQKGNIPTGDIYLEPKWKRDYAQLLKEFLSKKHKD